MKRQQVEEAVDYIDSPQVNFPPYAIKNGDGPLNLKTVATNATNHDGVQQYHLHNIFGYQSEVATQQALLKVNPGVRPFLLSRSTFPGSGKHMAHWLGDNYSLWEYLKYSIQGVLQFQLFQASHSVFSRKEDCVDLSSLVYLDPHGGGRYRRLQSQH